MSLAALVCLVIQSLGWENQLATENIWVKLKQRAEAADWAELQRWKEGHHPFQERSWDHWGTNFFLRTAGRLQTLHVFSHYFNKTPKAWLTEELGHMMTILYTAWPLVSVPQHWTATGALYALHRAIRQMKIGLRMGTILRSQQTMLQKSILYPIHFVILILGKIV